MTTTTRLPGSFKRFRRLRRTRCAAEPRRGDATGPARLRVPAVRDAWERRARGDRVDAGAVPPVAGPAGGRGAGAAGARRAGGAAVRTACLEGRPGHRGVRVGRHRAGGRAHAEGRRPGPVRDLRRLPVRVHGPRPLRHPDALGRGRERHDAGAAGADGGRRRPKQARTWSPRPT